MAQRIKPPATTLGRFFDDTVKRLARARLAYGHGTTNARDEAAFIVLDGLGLPIDRLDPYRELQLSDAEQRKLTTLVHRRIKERVPAPYLLGSAYMQGVRFHSDRRALIPRSLARRSIDCAMSKL